MGKKAPAAARLPDAAATDPLLGLSVRPQDTEVQRPTFSERRARYAAMPPISVNAWLARSAAQTIDRLQAIAVRANPSEEEVTAIMHHLDEEIVLFHERLEGGPARVLGRLHREHVSFAGKEGASYAELAFSLLVERFLVVLAVVDPPAMVQWATNGRPAIGHLDPEAVLANWSTVQAAILGLPNVDTHGLRLRVEKELQQLSSSLPPVSPGAAVGPTNLRPRKHRKPNGRPPTWGGLRAIAAELRKANSAASADDIVARYNRKRGKLPKATTETLRQVDSYDSRRLIGG